MTPTKPPRATATSDAPAHLLDVCGTLCPVPVLRTARRVRQLATGALLEVLGDDPLMRLDLAAWCAREGHEVVVMEAEGGRVRCLLRVGGLAANGS
jgi:tRNA 2-thiouridine synthesizing protein A